MYILAVSASMSSVRKMVLESGGLTMINLSSPAASSSCVLHIVMGLLSGYEQCLYQDLV